MKKILFAVLVIIVIITLLVAVGFLIVISGAFSIFMPHPPKPDITYGEFPFSITYELDGETKVIEDTVVCEFDGFVNHGTAGKYRAWKAYLKSGNEEIVLLRIENNGVIVEISTIYGLPEYYMGDFRQSKEAYEKTMADDRYLGFYHWEDGVETNRSITKEEVFEKYNLRIIEIQHSQPIENSFG